MKERLSHIEEKSSVDSIEDPLSTGVSSTRCVGGDGLMDSPWPMKCHDQRHSGRSPYSTSNNSGAILWKFKCDWVEGGIVADNDGTIYFGSSWYLYALYPDGSLKRRYKTGGDVTSSPAIGSDGTVYVGSYDGYLYAVNSDGSLKWKCKIGYGSETNPPIGPDGTIYVGGSRLYAVNPVDGSLKWVFDLGPGRHIHQSSPAISSDGIVYVGVDINDTDGGEVVAVDPDGSICWRCFIANNWVESSPCIGEGGVVYIGSSWMNRSTGESYGYLYAFGHGNVPPEKPTINGPSSGKVGETYSYAFTAVDGNNDDLFYYVRWGDGSRTGWIGPYKSGETITLNHTWSRRGSFIIQAKAKDIYGLESGWSTLEVSMPLDELVMESRIWLPGYIIDFLLNHNKIVLNSLDTYSCIPIKKFFKHPFRFV